MNVFASSLRYVRQNERLTQTLGICQAAKICDFFDYAQRLQSTYEPRLSVRERRENNWRLHSIGSELGNLNQALENSNVSKLSDHLLQFSILAILGIFANFRVLKLFLPKSRISLTSRLLPVRHLNTQNFEFHSLIL